MYKLLLCWRYLRTRYIALASIVSVMLGVATMIVVNSVMAGFTHEMRNRIHAILSDIVFESHGLEGFPDADWYSNRIREIAGDSIEGMTPTVHVPAMLTFEYHAQWTNRQILFIGIDERTHSQVSDFGKYLQHPANREKLSLPAARVAATIRTTIKPGPRRRSVPIWASAAGDGGACASSRSGSGTK